MKALPVAIATVATLAAGAVSAAPDFPVARNVVGPDEYYLLDEFGDWRAMCLRDENDEDVCEASTTLSAPEQGLEMELAILPYAHYRDKADADVDILPIAIAVISPYSMSSHYDNYSAAITAVDGQPFDGYWCQLTEDACSRGPELDWDAITGLLDAREITVSIYDVDPATVTAVAGISSSFTLNPVTEFDVSLQDFPAAYERANSFSAEAWGIDLEQNDTQVNSCSFSYQGQARHVSYTYDEDYDTDHTSFREILRGPRGDSDCPSYVMLASLTPDMTRSQRGMFCLDYDKGTKTYTGFQMGEANAYGICKAPSKSVCERVNETKAAAMAITGFATGSVGGAVGTTMVTGTTVVAHSSGAMILTGSGGYIAGTLGTIGTTALGVLTAPAAAAAAAVSVVAVGGAVYVCSE